jgi:hypothetical protein
MIPNTLWPSQTAPTPHTKGYHFYWRVYRYAGGRASSAELPCKDRKKKMVGACEKDSHALGHTMLLLHIISMNDMDDLQFVNVSVVE